MTFTAPQSPRWHYQIAYFVQATVQTPKRFSLQWHKTTILVFQRLEPAFFFFNFNYFLSKYLINILSAEFLSYVELAVCVVLIILAQETAHLYFCFKEQNVTWEVVKYYWMGECQGFRTGV